MSRNALGAVPNVRAAAFSRAPPGTTSATTLAGLPFNGLDGIAPTSRGLLLDAQKSFAFVVDCTQAKEFALAHWLVNGADGGRLFVRCFDGSGIVRENVAGDVLASLSGTRRRWISRMTGVLLARKRAAAYSAM